MTGVVRALLVIVVVAPLGSERALAVSTKKPSRELGCEILDRGLYVPETQRVRFADPTSVTGERFEISDVRFVRQTKTIDATLGQRFGIRYRLRELPQRAVTITWRIVYPAPVRRSKGWEHSFRATPVGGELVQHVLYDFVYSSELVTGRWDFEVLVDGQRACSSSFQVQ